ncbi:MAG: ABC transporter permease, partial [Alphaproteobacteria bacterium]|nr:ABC transporter permease [Alphaproteobacteria bacterium]
ITYDYKIRLPAGADANAWTHTLAAAFPDAGWRLRTAQDAAPGLALMVDRMTMFLTFVGLTALLVGGVGVANAVRAYLEGKVAVIATFKSLGADAHLVFRIYLLQIMAIAGLGIAGGLILGAAAPLGVAGLVDQLLPVEIEIGVSVQPLVVASLFGALTALVFTIWPVAQAGDIPAATLFRNLVAPAPRWPRPVYVAATAVSVAALIGLAVATADRPLFALWFVAGAGAALAIFRLCGSAIIRAARAAPRMRGATWRLAVANLHRPGAPTASIVLSLGLGLAVLVAIAQTQGNLERRLIEDLPEAAPSFFVIDIQKDQLGAFNETVLGHAGVSEVQQVPMLRGRIAAIDGVAAENRAISADVSWTLQGDRGITWSATPVANSEVVEGQWWAEDYRGPTLISFDQATARGYGVGIGDTLTVNILGRLITGEIANLRRINWGTLGINFFMVFSPGALDGAPQTYLATVYAEPEVELALQSKIVGQFANITAVRVRDAIETVAGLVRRIALAIEVSALVTLFAGILVLGGAVAAGQRRRIYDAVIMKVLGATRGQLMRAFALEFGLIGLATALTALAVGTAAAWAVVTQILGMSWVFLPGPAIVTAIAGIAATLALGFAGTYAALSQKAAPHLRNE